MGGGGGGEPKSQVDRYCTLWHVHACDFRRPAEQAAFVSEEGEGSEFKMNDVRFRDDRKLLRRPLRETCVDIRDLSHFAPKRVHVPPPPPTHTHTPGAAGE